MPVLMPIAATQATGVPATRARPAAADATRFDDVLAQTGPAETTASAAFRHQSSRSGQLKPEQAFESFVLRSFIEEMLPKENTAVFGGGTAGNIWCSMLAERIADEMAASGGIGIADSIARDAPASAAD